MKISSKSLIAAIIDANHPEILARACNLELEASQQPKEKIGTLYLTGVSGSELELVRVIKDIIDIDLIEAKSLVNSIETEHRVELVAFKPEFQLKYFANIIHSVGGKTQID